MWVAPLQEGHPTNFEELPLDKALACLATCTIEGEADFRDSCILTFTGAHYLGDQVGSGVETLPLRATSHILPWAVIKYPLSHTVLIGLDSEVIVFLGSLCTVP